MRGKRGCVYIGMQEICSRSEADKLKQMIIQWKLRDKDSDKWRSCWCFDGLWSKAGKLIRRPTLTKQSIRIYYRNTLGGPLVFAWL
jgi:hypothetical protein